MKKDSFYRNMKLITDHGNSHDLDDYAIFYLPSSDHICDKNTATVANKISTSMCRLF